MLEAGDTYLDDGHSFHLSLAYIAAVLREHEIDVEILDAYVEDRRHHRAGVEPGWVELGLSNKQILARISEFSPELVGISIPFSCQHDLAVQLAQDLRDKYPAMLLVAGGNHITGHLSDPSLEIFDFRVAGEGEYVLLELIERLNQGETAISLPGIIPQDGTLTTVQSHIKELDQLPLPALDLLPLEKIWEGGSRWINMIATRGCVYDCVFCSIHTTMGYTIRRRSVENIIQEIDTWVRRYDIQEIYFEDDNLTIDPTWAKALFGAIAKRKYGLRLHVRNGVRADSLDEEILRLMKAAGFQDISISPESGSQRTLDLVIQKKQSLEACLQAVEFARRINLGINAFFVLGFVEETWDDLHQTAAFAHHLKELGCSGFWFSLATPFPGTRLFEEYKRSGLLPERIDFRTLRSVDYTVRHPIFTAHELKTFRDTLMEDLSSNRSILGKIKNAILLAVTDPEFFRVKFTYKMNWWRNRSRQLARNVSKLR